MNECRHMYEHRIIVSMLHEGKFNMLNRHKMFIYVKNHIQCMIIVTDIDCICTDELSKIMYTETFLLSF